MDSVRKPALNRAAELNHLDVVIVLLNFGADVNGDDFGFSALNEATRLGHVEVAELLISHGAKY